MSGRVRRISTAPPGSCPRRLRRPGRSNPPRLRREKTETLGRAHPRAARRRPWPPCDGPRVSAGWARVPPPWRRSDARPRSGAARPHQARTRRTGRPPTKRDYQAGPLRPCAHAPERPTNQTGAPPRREVWMLSSSSYTSERPSRSRLTLTTDPPPTDVAEIRGMRGLIVTHTGGRSPRPSQ